MPRWRFDTSTTLLWRGPRVPCLLAAPSSCSAVFLSPLSQGFRPDGRTTRPVHVGMSNAMGPEYRSKQRKFSGVQDFKILFKYVNLIPPGVSIATLQLWQCDQHIGGLLSA